MMNDYLENAIKKAQNIRLSEFSIYTKIPSCAVVDLWFSDQELEVLLNSKLVGISLKGLPNRSSSKKVKTEICKILGYPVPRSFKKTKPRFIGQNFDTYNQKAYNLQIWNERLSLARRYVLVRRNSKDVIVKIKVVRGKELEKLDRTGTITKKYQASIGVIEKPCELVSTRDTSYSKKFCGNEEVSLRNISPTSMPIKNHLLPIGKIYEILQRIVGEVFDDPGSDQERNRGAALHRLVCQVLGFTEYQDSGQFPDIQNQLLEIKLQISSTIDLGLVLPNSKELLGLSVLTDAQIRYCDVRYAIFCARVERGKVEVTNLILTTGADFFNRFSQFGGMIVYEKIQIPLPRNFFD